MEGRRVGLAGLVGLVVFWPTKKRVEAVSGPGLGEKTGLLFRFRMVGIPYLGYSAYFWGV